MTSIAGWVRRHDPNYLALRRAARTAVIMPSLFAVCFHGIGNLDIATYAAFGSLALLMLVDFAGPMRNRLQGQATLAAVGAIFITIGTLVSQTVWLSVVAMATLAFVTLLAGVMSSVLASATTSVLLVFILSTALPGPPSEVPDRLAGWAIASVVAFFAVWLLWPAKNQSALRISASGACRAVATSLRVDVAISLGTKEYTPEEREAATMGAHDATAALHRTFLAAPWRPTGLNTSSRATVRLVDELLWLDTVLASSPPPSAPTLSMETVCQIRSAAASVLETGADLLDRPFTSPAALATAQEELRAAMDATERAATRRVPSSDFNEAATNRSLGPGAVASDAHVEEFVASLEPGFRAQELGFATSLVGANIDLAAAADRRSWLDTVLGRSPGVPSGRVVAAKERVAAHFDRRSVWLHNSFRGAIGLALAVLIAKETGLQHAFWVILGALSVLRSSAINTGQNALRAVVGTAIGFFLGAGILALVGTNVTVLWFVLPFAILIAGFAPTAISFAAGQAGFTLSLVILYNLLQPVGWRVGLYRIEDISVGCAVSVVVGLLFWPHGASSAFSSSLRQAYDDAGAYLVAAVSFGAGRCDKSTGLGHSPEKERASAAASGRRLDDAFRTYIGEGGSKPRPLAEVTALVRSVATLRQTADAIVVLWSNSDPADGERARARAELSRDVDDLQQWFGALGASLNGGGTMPDAPDVTPASDDRLIEAVREDLRDANGHAATTAVRLIWTKDYLDAVRRVGATLVEPARASTSVGAAVTQPA